MVSGDIKINIIGAGISGLIAAKVLEDHGFSPLIVEASDRVGGRVKTDIVKVVLVFRFPSFLLTKFPREGK